MPRLAQELQERRVHLDLKAPARVQHGHAVKGHNRVAGGRRTRLRVFHHAVMEHLRSRKPLLGARQEYNAETATGLLSCCLPALCRQTPGQAKSSSFTIQTPLAWVKQTLTYSRRAHDLRGQACLARQSRLAQSIAGVRRRAP